MGRVGRARVLADFSREAVSRQYVTLLTEAIRPAGAGNPS
jgi:hypothetical protein